MAKVLYWLHKKNSLFFKGSKKYKKEFGEEIIELNKAIQLKGKTSQKYWFLQNNFSEGEMRVRLKEIQLAMKF